MIPPEVDETLAEGPIPDAVAGLARRKAEAICAAHPDAAVLGGDTVVVVGGEVLGKPRDDEDARRMLQRASGAEQQVVTGVALLCPPLGFHREGAVVTRVWMRELSVAEIDAYVESGEPRGKAGAYAIQETGDRFVRRIEGPFDNVVGLPLGLVSRWLDELDSVSGSSS